MNKIKEFFKLTTPKVILSVVIFAVFVPFIIPHEIQCIQAPCPELGAQSVLTLMFMGNLSSVVGINYINLFVGLIISYLLSSLIIFIIKKTNKNKK